MKKALSTKNMRSSSGIPDLSFSRDQLSATAVLSSPNESTISLMEKMDHLFSTLRSKKISMSVFHAIIKLYMVTNSNKDNLILSTLALKLGITTAAITSVVDSIESLGFATRSPNPDDRRLISVKLTAEGVKFAESFGSFAKSAS